jgi:hypothetical protein
MTNIKNNLLGLMILIIIVFVSGCGLKDVSQTDESKTDDVQIDTSDWLIYNYDKRGISFKHPELTNILINGVTSGFSPFNCGAMRIEIGEKDYSCVIEIQPQKISLLDYNKQNIIEEYKKDYPYKIVESVKSVNVDGYLFKDGSLINDRYLFIINNRIEKIYLSLGTDLKKCQRLTEAFVSNIEFNTEEGDYEEKCFNDK